MKRWALGSLAALFWLGVLSPFLGAKEEAKEEEKIQDIFEPPIRPMELNIIKGDTGKVSLRLDGIGLGAGKAFAVINGKIYLEGEEKEGIRVTHVRKKEVDILINGFPETLQLIRYEGLAGVRTEQEEDKQAQRASHEP